MYILSIESSCDDSALAYTDGKSAKLLWHKKISQESAHNPYGGVVPELASRLFAHDLVQLLQDFKRQFHFSGVTHIAVTNEPGLSTSLLEGNIMAKALSLSLQIPLLGINHLKGHIYSLFIESLEVTFPLSVLLVSGGHTMLLECYGYDDMRVVAHTLDDSFGECYDKASKMLGLGYPGGMLIDSLAQKAQKQNIKHLGLPIPLANQNTPHFSFSGLKNAFRLELATKKELTHLIQQATNSQDRNQKDSYIAQIKEHECALALALSLQESATTHIAQKCKHYMQQSKIEHFAIVGGASANSMLRTKMQNISEFFHKKLLLSELLYCSDNAAMIGRAALAKITSKNLSNKNDMEVQHVACQSDSYMAQQYNPLSLQISPRNTEIIIDSNKALSRITSTRPTP